MSSRSDNAVVIPAVLMPDETQVSFAGSLSITKTTLTVSKSANRRGESPLFIGVCSLPLIQFYRQKQTVTLIRGTSYLFDNAALSAGLGSYSTPPSSLTRGGANAMATANIDNPTAWATLTVRVDSLSACDRVVEALLARHAEEVFAPPFPIGEVPPPVQSAVTPTPTSARSSNRHSDASNGNGRRRLDSDLGSTKSYNRHNEFRPRHEHGSSTPPSSQRPASSHISDRGEREESAVRSNNGGPTPKASSETSSITTRSSRLPSRREHDDDTLSSRSSRLPSRRDHDETATSTRYTPSETIRSSQRVASRRHDVEAMTPASTAASRSDRLHGAPAADRTRTGDGATPHRRSASAAKRRERRPVDPIEREFREMDRYRRARTSSRNHRRSPTSGASESTPAISRDSPRRAHSSSHHHRHRSPRTASTPGNEDTYMTYSNSITPRSVTLSSRQRTEQDQFFRTVQRLQHHRLHFMTYLHKEMVHQAYVAEEVKVRAAGAAAAGRHRSTSSRRASSVRRDGTPRSARNNSSGSHMHRGGNAAEESTRLREIEARMAEVEAVHREAEREREAAARLRREYEWRLEELPRTAAVAGMGGIPHGGVSSRDASEFNSSTLSPHRRSSAYASGAGQVILPSENGTRSGAGAMMYPTQTGAGTGQLMLYNDAAAAAVEPQPDLGIAIVDRYIFGDEWHRLFPSQEVDVRFNAQIDVCLALKMPREKVTITNLVVDQPGLRVTAEVSHDHNRISRETIERRINSSPFRFLQRMYEMRDLFDPQNRDSAGAILPHSGGGSQPYAIRSSSSNAVAASQQHQSSSYGRGSGAGAGALIPYGAGGGRASSRGPSRTTSRRSSRYPGVVGVRGDLAGDESYSSYNGGDVEARRRELQDRQEARAQRARERLERKHRQLGRDVRRQLRDLLDQLEEEEENSRRRVKLAEATTRQDLMKNARRHQKATLAGVIDTFEQAETVARATIEVGAARQFQALVGAHRRQAQLAAFMDSERQRRRAIADQESFARENLNATMNPASSPHALLAQRGDAERQHRERLREREAKARRMAQESMEQYRAAAAREAMDDLVADERAARAALMTDAMTAWLDILCVAPRGGRGFRRLPSIDPRTTARQMLRELVDNEASDRAMIRDEEARRRQLYAKERVAQGEAIDRDRIEGDELTARGSILDGMVQQNRAALERRLADREQIATLVNEEQFYRSTILADEQDAFEVLAELFAEGLKDLLNRIAEAEPEEDMPTPRRRQFGSRQAKPFHYMTFSPEDMDFPPSAVLAIEGILGCGINKNLEVTSISRPLPKAEEEDLQFQAGDMILDVAGHSLHSLSHLREVLSSRTMQIQGEALEEFPDVPEGQRTTNPALQKYIEVLCEHHNFLVQVLRGCDIFQIIVKS